MYLMARNLWEEMERIAFLSPRPFITVTGGGGKTTFLIEFSSYLKKKGKSVLVTTSTKLAPPWAINYKVDSVFLTESVLSYWPKRGETVFFAKYDEERGKTVAPRKEIVSSLFSRYDVVIVEGDGSRRMPLKKHSERDPVVWKETTMVVSVSGMWGYGKEKREVVFGEEEEGIVDSEYLSRLLLSPQGMGKGMDKGSYSVFLFNGGDVVEKNVEEVFLSLPFPPLSEAYSVSMEKGVIYGSL